MPTQQTKTKVVSSNGKKPQPERPTEVRIIFNEAGTLGLKENSGFVYEAYNAALYWPQVQSIYSRLRTSMPEIVMVRRTFSSWSRNIQPVVDLPEDANDDDKRYQEFLQSDFENMDGGFSGWLETCINQVPFFGWGWWDVQASIRDHEWRPPVRDDHWQSEADDGLIGLRRLAWRDTSTFNGWIFGEGKRLLGMKQQDYPNPPVDLWLDKSLHMTFGDMNNPEGSTPLEAVWRLERIKYGLEVIQGMGFEHAAGHLSVKKVEKGDISNDDRRNVKDAAMAILAAQEGNYAIWPFGLDGNVVDIPFSAAGSILEAIKYYGILVLSLYTMQWISLNTMTNTGALASQVDSTSSGIFAFNAMLDGFASQYDQQIGRRLWEWNKLSFPNATKRPNIRFSHIENNIDLGALGSFFSAIFDKLPLGQDDWDAIRKQTGFLPETTPDDALEEVEKKKEAAEAAQERFANAPVPGQEDQEQTEDTEDSTDAQLSRNLMRDALELVSRSTRL